LCPEKELDFLEECCQMLQPWCHQHRHCLSNLIDPSRNKGFSAEFEEFSVKRERAATYQWQHDTGARLCSSQVMWARHSHVIESVCRTEGAKVVFPFTPPTI